MAASVATILARAFAILRGSPNDCLTAIYIAGICGLDIDQAERACVRLVNAKLARCCGVDDHYRALYQLVEGAERPGDGRGKHRGHLTGATWALRRKRRANLVKARALKRHRALMTRLNK